jgi:hypothetical protein
MKTKFFRKNAFVKAGAHVSTSVPQLRVGKTTAYCYCLLLLLLCPVGLAAQNGVTVSNLNVAAGMVTFNVSWDKNSDELQNIVWLDSVWVFVDYNAGGVMERLPLSAGATLTNPSWSGASITQPNTQGAWVIGNAKTADLGSFSATVQLLTATANFSGACVYASNYPPVGEYITSQTVKFAGTPPYDLVFNEGGDTTTRQGAYTVPAGKTLASFTDATGVPGTFTCKVPLTLPLIASAQGYCEGSPGVTFAMDGTEPGVTYQLIKNDMDVVATLSGTGSAEAFDGSHTAGVYTAKSAAGDYCAAAMYGARTVSVYPLPAEPTISSAGTACVAYVLTALPGADGDGIRWEDGSSNPVRTVTSAGTYFAAATSPNHCRSETLGSFTVTELSTPNADDGGPCYSLPTTDACPESSVAKGKTFAIKYIDIGKSKNPVDLCAVRSFCETTDCTNQILFARNTTAATVYAYCKERFCYDIGYKGVAHATKLWIISD